MAETLVSKIVANAGKNWSRNTVADGNWLNANTIVKLNQNDKTLAEAIDDLSASMPHILPEYPGFKLNFESNETIKSIEQKTTGELIVEKQGIDIESTTLNDKLWAHLQTNKGCPVNNQYTKLYDEGEDPPDLNYLEPGDPGDGCTSTNLVLKPGIYSIYLELAYKPGNTIERIEKELSVRLCKGIDQIAEFTFHCNDTYTEINQHRLVNAVVKFEEQGTLVIEGKTESGHAGGTLQIVNLYIVSVGGATGPKGDEGDPGADGFSPIVEITEGTRQHTISITDKTHTATTLINDGADGSNGKSVELSANPLNAHLNWRQEGDTNWTDTGYAVSGAVGPRGTAPTVTSVENPNVGGYDVTFHYGDTLEDEKTITVPSGISGVSGTSLAAYSNKVGKNTTVDIYDPVNDPTHQHPITSFVVSDGNDGTGAGSVTDIIGDNGIKAEALDAQNSKFKVSLSGHYYPEALSAYSAEYARAYWDSVNNTSVNFYDEFAKKLDKPTYPNKEWLYSTNSNNWCDAYNWLANRIVPEDGLSGWGDATNGLYHFGISADYVATSGDTMTGELIMSGVQNNFDNQFVKCVVENVTPYCRFGATTAGRGAIKSYDGNNRAQIWVDLNTSKGIPDIKATYNDGTIYQLIPMQVHTGSYTPSSDDGILHIVVES